MLHELLIAVRTLVKRLGYSASIIGTLTLGIAGTTLMFSLLDAVLLRPLPFADPDRLVFLTGVAGPDRSPRGGSFPEIADWRSLNQTLQDVAIYDETSLTLKLDAEAIRVETEMVSASYFPLLGVRAAMGRTFLASEDAVADRDAVVVISSALWKQRFGGAADVLNRTIHLNDRPFTIVGVMPDGFAGVSFDTDVWIPSMMVSLTSAPSVITNRGTRWLGAIGRLRDGTTLPRAQQDMDRVASTLEQQYPNFNQQRGVQVQTLEESLAGSTATLVLLLFAAVLLFLAVTCANVASLQLANAAARRRELAVRFALGARRWHVVRQLLLESIVLAVTAGSLGMLLAAWALGGVLSLTPAGALPRYVQPSLDARAIAFALGMSLLAGALVAALPAAAATRRDLSEAMKEGGARAAGPGLGSLRRPSPQQVLVVAEIALAMTLLTAAGLMMRSLERQLQVPIGFNPEGVTVARVTLPDPRYAPDARPVFAERLVERLREIPRVQSAAIATSLPFTGNSSAATMPDVARDSRSSIRYYRNYVTPEFFSTLGIDVKQGRAFTAQDRADSPLVVIMNESGARRIWGNENAIGRKLYLGGAGSPVAEVVGVAADARFRSLTDDLSGPRTEPEVFFPFAQRTDRDIELAVRTLDGSTVPLSSLQQAIAGVDLGLPLYVVQPLGAAVGQQTSTARFGSTLLGVFSAGALLLAAVGLYGLVAYVVGLSRREIAIRLALGADSRRLVLLIVRNGMILVTCGIALGTVGAVVAGRSLNTQLFQTPAVDPLTLASVAGLLLGVTLLASALPTRRAVRVEPQSALRAE